VKYKDYHAKIWLSLLLLAPSFNSFVYRNNNGFEFDEIKTNSTFIEMVKKVNDLQIPDQRYHYIGPIKIDLDFSIKYEMLLNKLKARFNLK